jgi:hypothetical protein
LKEWRGGVDDTEKGELKLSNEEGIIMMVQRGEERKTRVNSASENSGVE